LSSLTFNVAQGIQPDRYVGQVALKLDGASKPVVAPIDLTIRRGPLEPLILLIVGLFGGILLREARKRVLPLGDASARWEDLARQITGTPLAGSERQRMDGRMALARAALRAGDPATATTQMDSIVSTLRVFDLLWTLRVSLLGRSDAAAIAALGHIGEARGLLFGQSAKPDLDAALQKYADALAVLAPADASILDSAPITTTAAPTDGRGAAADEGGGGRGTPGADVWLGIVRVLRYVIRGTLVILALASGMLALYVAPTAGFIGNTFADAALLLFWGFGSGWVDKVFVNWE
jgi:hypothetical protein